MFEVFLRNDCHLLCPSFSIIDMAAIRKGSVTNDASASFGFLTSIMTATATSVIKSGMSVVTLSESIFFNELTSPITLARIFPVGLVSKKWKLNF